MNFELMEEKLNNDPVRGHVIKLDDERLVFLGQHPDLKDKYHLGFRNDNEEDTRIALSKEAMEALMKLYKNPPKDDPVQFPYRFSMAWQVTIVDDATNDSKERITE